MKLEISKQVDNPLLNRKEVFVHIENNGSTPRAEDLTKELSALLNAAENLIVIESIKQKFGIQECEAYVKIYNSEEDLKKVEPKLKEKPQPKEEKAEEPKEEKKEGETEEKKEEKPKEAEPEKKGEKITTEVAGGNNNAEA